MKNKFLNISFYLSIGTLFLLAACGNDDNGSLGEAPRLFQPVLNEDLYSEGNEIYVDMAKLTKAIGYTLEVSRDTFQMIDYRVDVDTNFVILNKELLGQDLYWNTIYQVRAVAHASDPEKDSNWSDFGNVRTQRFPTILNLPGVYDVTDKGARPTWQVLGDPVTSIKVFAINDLGLQTPLFPEQTVTAAEAAEGSAIVLGLSPETEYQIAIYSNGVLRGWANYKTREPDVDPNGANVIDLSNNEDPNAVVDALATAPDGALILVKHGVEYVGPSQSMNSSVTIQAAYGFGEQRAVLLFSSNLDMEPNANVGYIKFVGLELRGTSWSSKYVMNASKASTLGEMTFENCYITNFRGIFRIKDSDQITVDSYNINNCIVDSLGSYGVMTIDKQGSVIKNVNLTNSTFNRTIYFLVSKSDIETLLIDNCTLANLPETGRQLLRWRESGTDNITGGVTISNSILGHSWDQTNEGNYGAPGIQGLANTSFNLVNNWSPSDFSFSSDEIPGFPIGNYSGTQDDLWKDALANDFNFKDSGFSGRTDSGDPRWRTDF